MFQVGVSGVCPNNQNCSTPGFAKDHPDFVHVIGAARVGVVGGREEERLRKTIALHGLALAGNFVIGAQPILCHVCFSPDSAMRWPYHNIYIYMRWPRVEFTSDM